MTESHRRIEISLQRGGHLRKKLLDLSARNNLISFRHDAAHHNQVRVIDELLDVLYSRITRRRDLQLCPLPDPLTLDDEDSEFFRERLEQACYNDPEFLSEWKNTEKEREATMRNRIARQLRRDLGWPDREQRQRHKETDVARMVGLNPDYHLPQKEEGSNQSKYRDTLIQTLLFPEAFGRKLAGLYRKQRLILSETGISALYAAFGFLQWSPDEDKDVSYISPLLLVPVDLIRQAGEAGFSYILQARDDEVLVNPSLRERLTRDFGLVLPEHEDPRPESYLASVSHLCRSRRDWCVKRFLTIGLFSFSRTVMYKDLADNNWPGQDGVWKHPVVLDLLAGRDVETIAASLDEDSIEASQIRELPLVANADASQTQAILQVLAGKNLVIEGPPGTGKSQTITNIIAACMARGKRVLFVAEKMAALEVVHKRLEHVGLGPFCLELHSAKANKKQVMARLKQSLEHEGECRVHKDQWQAARRLDRYDRLLHLPVWPKGPSCYQLIWRLARLQQDWSELAGLLQSTRIGLVETDQEAWRIKMRDAVATYAQAWQAFVRAHGSPADHPWCGLQDPNLDVPARERLCRMLAAQLALLDNIDQNLGAIHRKSQLTMTWSIKSSRDFFHLIDQIGAGMTGRAPTTAMLALAQEPLQLARLRELLDVAVECQQLLAGIRHATPAFDPNQPEPVIAQLQHLDELIGAEPELAQQAGPLTSLCQSYAKKLERRQDLTDFAHELCADLGFEGPVTVAVLKQASRVVSLAVELPENVRPFYLPELLSPTCHPQLVQAKNAFSVLLRIRGQLEDQVVLETPVSPARLKKAAVRLKKVSFLNAWTSSAREAVAIWQRVARTNNPLSNQARGDLMSELSNYLRKYEQFRKDKKLQQLCGAHFAGLDTPLSELLAVNQWALRIHKTFRPKIKKFMPARELLLKTDAAGIFGLAAQQEHPEWNNLQTLLGEAEGDQQTLTELVAAREQRLARLQEARILARDLGWSSRVPLGQAGVLAADAVRFSLLCRCLNEGRDLLAQLGLGGWNQQQHLMACCATAKDLASILALNPPPGLIHYLFDNHFEEKLAELKALSNHCSSPLHELATQMAAMMRAFAIDEQKWYSGNEWDRVPLEKLAAKIRHALEHRDALHDLSAFLDFEAELAKAGLGELIDCFYKGSIDSSRFIDAFDYAWLRTVGENTFRLQPELKSFSVGELEKIRTRFAERDRDWINAQGSEIVDEIQNVDLYQGNNKGPKKTWTGLALIENEVEKMARHLPIRELLKRAGKTVQQLTPCFLMSPLSVAQFLGPGTVDFDLVIMDEASQMRPQDAISAIARGRQLVVVGDPKQLGPTSFFQATNQGDEDDLENLIDESILEMALKNFVAPCRLKWHYRSRHPSLIACSNRLFYDDDLVVFPSPRPDDPRFGFGVHFVPDGVYHKGVNPGEANAVIRAAFRLMKSEPGTSLGIVCVNQSQQELIEEKLDQLMTNQASALAYLKRWQDTLEPPFVKNLENVQGDERDVILVSTVYGRDKQGQFYRRFGPINRQDGQRRLNVLFTRARQRLGVYTSMKAEWIKLDKKTGEGVRALRSFLEHGREQPNTRQSTSDFARVIGQRLADSGYRVEQPQCNHGHFVALAIRDPAQPEFFLLGINGDAACTGPFAAVRERERLRGEVLSHMGWRLHRIWSVDWARDPEAVWQTLLKALQSASVG